MIIICHGGMATSTLLRQRLSICMPTLSVTKICRYEDLDSEIPAIRPVSDMNKINEELSKIAYRKRNFRLIKRIDTNRAPTIRSDYAEDMISVVQKMGNYMIFIPEIAFVHTKTDRLHADIVTGFGSTLHVANLQEQ